MLCNSYGYQYDFISEELPSPLYVVRMIFKALYTAMTLLIHLQTLMNALIRRTNATKMLTALTQREATLALVNLDTMEMEGPAQVSLS